MGKSIKSFAKSIHSKIGNLLEGEKITPRGGSSLINHTKDSIYKGLTPTKLATVLNNLREGNPRDFLILAEEFEEKDPHFISVIQTRKRALITVEPTLLIGDIKNKAVIEACYKLIEKPFFTNLVMDLLDAISKGFSVCEILWSDNDVIGYKYLPAYWFSYDDNGELKIWDDMGSKLLPIVENDSDGYFYKKFIIHAPSSKSSVQLRNGLTIPASIYLLYKAFAMRDFMSFAEVFGMPLRVGKYDNEPTDKDIATLRRAVTELGVDAAAIIPKSMDINFVEVNKGDGAGLYTSLLDYIDKQISKLILGQTMTSDDGSSQAQAKVHNDIRLDIVKSDARELEATLNQFIRSYIDQVVGIQKEYPKIKWQIQEKEDRVALADVLTKVLPLGLEVSKSDVIERLGFIKPLNTQDDVLRYNPYTNLPPIQKNSGQKNSIQTHSKEEIEKDSLEELQDIILTDESMSDIEEDLVKPVLDIINSAKDYDDLQEKLNSAKLNGKKLQDILSEATSSASILGDQKDAQ